MLKEHRFCDRIAACEVSEGEGGIGIRDATEGGRASGENIRDDLRRWRLHGSMQSETKRARGGGGVSRATLAKSAICTQAMQRHALGGRHTGYLHCEW